MPASLSLRDDYDAGKGTRPRQPADQRYKNAYLFGAICPAKAKGAAIVMPKANTHAMQLHLDEIAHNVAKGAHQPDPGTHVPA